MSDARARTPRASQTNRSFTGGGNAAQKQQENGLTDEQNQRLLLYVGYFFATVAALRIVTNYIYLFVFGPILYLYMVQVCPSDESFDVRKELKRVMRGHHLPDDHPDKPKGFFGELGARMAATVTTELATGMGYEVTTWNLYRAIIIKWVRVPAAKMDFYWVGSFSKWTYVYCNEIPDQKTD